MFPSSAPVPGPQEVASQSKPTTPRVLIVDDECIVLTICSNMLINLDFRVDVASSGNEALEYLKKHRYDLVLSDLIMPEMDGVELAGRIRQLAKNTKIVIMTGATQNQVWESINTTVADRWLFKPIGFSQLEEMVSHFFPSD